MAVVAGGAPVRGGGGADEVDRPGVLLPDRGAAAVVARPAAAAVARPAPGRRGERVAPLRGLDGGSHFPRRLGGAGRDGAARGAAAPLPRPPPAPLPLGRAGHLPPDDPAGLSPVVCPHAPYPAPRVRGPVGRA